MNTISQLKNNLIIRLKELENIHLQAHEQLFVDVSSKKVIVKYFYETDNKEQKSECRFAIEAKNVEKLKKTMFLQFSSPENNVLENPCNLQLYKEVFNHIITFWLDYAKLKNEYLFIDVYNRDNNLTTKWEQFLIELGFFNCTEYSKILDCEHINLSNVYGYLGEEQITYLSNMLTFHSELNEVRISEPTFFMDSYDYNQQKGLFRLERQNYYFENALFKIIPRESFLFVEGKQIPKKRFDFKKGVMLEILDYIKEQMKMPNLLKPPRKHFSYLVKNHLKINSYKINLEYKYCEIENIIEEGQLENESAYMVDIFKRAEKKAKKNLRDEEFKVIQTNLFCKMYKIQTQKYAWYIIVNIEAHKFWMIPTKNRDKTPQQVIDIILFYLEGKCLLEA
ncbi:hypothetical protein CON36_33095 [Bacillus cereus]|uniref:Uncharacterized protein n=1 Tax=Bacillus cereus TaxID=1396 RepID=A0A9X6ST18_BACCE|nr:hypothetical protein [Bacillus cereus]PDZ94572.1 hypothetical protein CON36_33095 [Bacillus cereus]PGP14424.1 hypothetical protein COA01_29095 [Bacillus cereus]